MAWKGFRGMFNYLWRGSPENPNTSISEWIDSLNSYSNSSGESVSENSSMGLPAFYRGVDLISSDVASLPLKVYTETNEIKTQAKAHPVYKLLHSKPSPYMNSFQFRKLMQVWALVHGNAYALIVWNHATARPIELLPFDHSLVDCVLSNSELIYRFKTNQGAIHVDQSNVLHVKGLGFDGIKGKGVIEMMAEMLGQNIAAQKTTGSFYKKGMRLDGVVSTDNKLDKNGLKLLRQTWKETYGGATGERVAILDNGMKFNPISVTPEQAQFIESKKFGVVDVARALGVPPTLLFSLENATFKNAGEMSQVYGKHYLRHWLVNWEAELNDKLFMEAEKENTYAEFNMEGLLRGDIQARSQFYKDGIAHGWFAPNDVRKKENMNGYEGGENYFIMANLQTVERAVQEGDLPIPAKQNGKAERELLMKMFENNS